MSRRGKERKGKGEGKTKMEILRAGIPGCGFYVRMWNVKGGLGCLLVNVWKGLGYVMLREGGGRIFASYLRIPERYIATLIRNQR